MSARTRGHLRLVGPAGVGPEPVAAVDVVDTEAAYELGVRDALAALDQLEGSALSKAFDLGRKVERRRWEVPA